MEDTKLFEKIQQLLAMAEHPNSNENEAAVALEKAQELLLRNNLTRGDVITGAPANDSIGQLTIAEPSGYTWKRNLVDVLARGNLCKVIGSPSSKQWHIFGTRENVRAVLEMYTWSTLHLVFMANRDFRAYKNDEGSERGQTWKANYYAAATRAINERLKKPIEQFSQGAGTALVVRNTTEVNIAVKKVFPHLKTNYTRAGGGDGGAAGYRTGQGMTLTPSKGLSGRLLLA